MAAPDRDIMGPAAATSAQDHRPRALSPRLEFRARRTERLRRSCPFLRRARRTRRHPGRERWCPLRSARCTSARCAADLCRLLYLAWCGQRGRSVATRAGGSISLLLLLPAAAATGHLLSDRGI